MPGKISPKYIMSRKSEKNANIQKPNIPADENCGHEILKINRSEEGYSGKKQSSLYLVLISILLSVLVLITYRNAFDNDFVDWDDYTYVVENNLVRNPQGTTIKDVFSNSISLNYHPLTILSLRWNNNICKTCREGISPAPFIRWNVIIHLLNTILVFLLIYLLSKKNLFVSFFVAAVFGVHPMHVESVAWISERKDVLYSFFFLSGLITYYYYLRSGDNKKEKYGFLTATFILFILSCLSKAMAVVFPLVLILIKFWTFQPEGKSPIKKSIKETFSLKTLLPLIPFFLAALFFGILAISINKFNSFTLWHRIQYASYGFVMYIIKFFIPVKLVAIYPYPTQPEYYNGTFGMMIKSAPFVVLFVSGLVAYSLKKTKLFVFGFGFFLITVMLVLQIISVGTAIMADRYIYLAFIGIAFIIAMLLSKYLDKVRPLLYILSGIFIVIMIVLAQKQTEIWCNSETLWTRTIELYPALETPRSLRGIYYSKSAKLTTNLREKKLYEDKALEDFEIAIKAETPRADVFEGAGCIYGQRGDYNTAIGCLNKAIQIKPRKGSAYFNRAITLSNLNRNEEAIKDYNMALIYSPENAIEILTNRSNIFLATGQLKEALADLDYLISSGNKNFLFYYNRAVIRVNLRDIAGAISDYQDALKLQPDDLQTKNQLLMLLKK
jgi:tetratricopeptide (TPR) repeat protein